MKNLLEHALQLQINTEKATTQHEALTSAIVNVVKKFRQPDGISARDVVVQLMECTCLLPGVFNVQMLSWRQKLQDLVHNPNPLSSYSSLQYRISLSPDTVNDRLPVRSVATQTSLVNPNSNDLLEFKKRVFHLKWTLQD